MGSRVRESHALYVRLASRISGAVAVAVTYYLGARLGFALTPSSTPVAVLWPPNAILLGALLIAPPRVWPWLLAAAFPAHIAAERGAGVPILMLMCWYVSNCAEAIVGAVITRRLTDGAVRLDSLRGVNAFLFGGAIAAPFLSSFLDAGFVRLNHWGDSGYWSVFSLRFSSNVLAILAFVPAIVTWGHARRLRLRELSWRRTLEASLLALSLLALYAATFLEFGIRTEMHRTLMYMPLPFLIWAAVRFGPAGASTALIGFAVFSAWGAVHSAAPCVGAELGECVLSMHLYLIFTFVPLLALSAMLLERERLESIRRSETALRESRVRLRELADAMPQIVWSARADGDIDYLNERWYEFALPQAGASGQGAWLEAMHSDDRIRYVAAWNESLCAGQPHEFEARFRSAGSQHYRWHLIRALPAYDNAGRVSRWYGTATDIDDHKKIEEALRDSENRLRALGERLEQRVLERTEALSLANQWLREEMESRIRAQHALQALERQLAHMGRVAVLGEMATALAHELNQPLAAILANTRAMERLLKRGMLETTELTAICEDVIADDLRAGSVIRRIRTLIRKEDVDAQEVAVNDLVMEVLELMHSDLLLREVSVSTSLGPVPPVSGDRVQLQQVLMNLIVNACDAMGVNASGDRGLAIATRDDEALACIEITDHGSGIPGESVFEPFVTTKPQGLGLGLAICRSIITAHGGRIWATNNPDRGATLHVTLPSARSAPIQIPPGTRRLLTTMVG